MEKKTILLELPCELVEKIDRLNTLGDRSLFVTKLLEEQLQKQETQTSLKTTISTTSSEITPKTSEPEQTIGIAGEISLIKSNGVSLGTFNINTVEGFEKLAKKIQEISEDPIVRIKARRLL